MNFCHDIAQMTAWRFGLTLADLRGPSRASRVIAPRHLAMHLCREMTDCSTTRIGQFFNRDHSTILSAISRSSWRIETGEVELRDAVHIIVALKLCKTRQDLPVVVHDRRRVLSAEQAAAQALETIAAMVGRARANPSKPVYGRRSRPQTTVKPHRPFLISMLVPAPERMSA